MQTLLHLQGFLVNLAWFGFSYLVVVILLRPILKWTGRKESQWTTWQLVEEIGLIVLLSFTVIFVLSIPFSLIGAFTCLIWWIANFVWGERAVSKALDPYIGWLRQKPVWETLHPYAGWILVVLFASIFAALIYIRFYRWDKR